MLLNEYFPVVSKCSVQKPYPAAYGKKCCSSKYRTVGCTSGDQGTLLEITDGAECCLDAGDCNKKICNQNPDIKGMSIKKNKKYSISFCGSNFGHVYENESFACMLCPKKASSVFTQLLNNWSLGLSKNKKITTLQRHDTDIQGLADKLQCFSTSP